MNLLLYGPPVGALEEIRTIIEKKCGAKSENYPDVHFFQTSREKKAFGVELAEEIDEILKELPFGDTHYIVISDFSKATIDCQNMLLKSLEDHPAAEFYLASTTENVLATIKSRCTCRSIKRTYEEFLKDYTGKYPLETYFIQNGDSEEVEEKVIKIFLAVKEAILQEESIELFSVLHLVKEKDKEAFSMLYPFYEKGLIAYIAEVLLQKGIDKENLHGFLLSVDEIKEANKGNYTKDDFFDYIVNLVHALNGGKNNE